jgi:hypothetical protein
MLKKVTQILGMEEDQKRRKSEDALTAFLNGTLCLCSPLSRLRGQSDILRHIWLIACEEWWHLHIERFVDEIPYLDKWDRPSSDDYTKQYPEFRQQRGGCPVAVVEKDVYFPPLSQGPIEEFGTDYLYVNMLPIELDDIEGTVPDCCAGYLAMLDLCRQRMQTGWRRSTPKGMIGYLTIDERPCEPGESQRRGGLHVESPGVLPVTHSIRDLKYAMTGNFVPGAEHHWGNGMMMRDESFQGGIYMASNIADTCAVWNCRVNDPEGDIVGLHGNIERLRSLLGPPTMKLGANELVWMTDRTPHESLPLPPDMAGARRQYFRLVVGEVTAWFADHSTPNPLGTRAPPSVRVVTGNKFEIPSTMLCRKWRSGSNAELQAARDELELRTTLHLFGLGHCADILIRHHSIRSKAQLTMLTRNEMNVIWDDYGSHYYDVPQMHKLLSVLRENDI